MKNKKAQMEWGIGLFVILIIGIITIVVIGKSIGFGIFGQTIIPSGNYIQVPTFMYYECSPASAPIDSPRTYINGGVAAWVRCPSNTDSCDLYVQSDEEGFFFLPRRIVYQVCNDQSGLCQSQVIKEATGWSNVGGKATVVIPNLNKYDRVYINYQKKAPLVPLWSDVDGASYFARYKPFILWKVGMLNGGRNEYTSIEQGCTFPTSDRGKLLNSITNLIGISVTPQSSSSNSVLEPYKTRNFIESYIPMSVENVNFVTYNGKQGYCLNRQVFAIAEVQTNDGIYKIVNSNFDALLSPSVECCPNEKEPTRVCGNDFNWTPIEIAQCNYFKPCAGADWAKKDSTTDIRYNCVNGACVSETRKVECNDNSACIGNPNGNICDTYLKKCVNIPTPIPSAIPSIIPVSDCAKKAQDQPWLGWTTSTETASWYQFWKPKTTQTCYASFMSYYIVGGILIVGIILFAFLLKPKSGSYRK